MAYLIATCLFFGTIFYWLIRKIWKGIKPKTAKFKLAPLPGILLISIMLFILIEYLINDVIHMH